MLVSDLRDRFMEQVKTDPTGAIRDAAAYAPYLLPRVIVEAKQLHEYSRTAGVVDNLLFGIRQTSRELAEANAAENGELYLILCARLNHQIGSLATILDEPDPNRAYRLAMGTAEPKPLPEEAPDLPVLVARRYRYDGTLGIWRFELEGTRFDVDTKTRRIGYCSNWDQVDKWVERGLVETRQRNRAGLLDYFWVGRIPALATLAV
ncbi:hypothetical protein LI90_4390 (plasmid) [Carbonactinospora thermoautotrophica]|uniref:Uncharacterized protein n=1 Tax=Carbonactinospora thermoautotrophica TaxID=1469144 RepID=A0A132MHW0_9ACTN|nr:hypothetical protein [Carbonactinospora thermoautotrophica]KWW97418.1 hypothetical protein LI90_4390 [Carbonactinospora thermoautotrophica]